MAKKANGVARKQSTDAAEIIHRRYFAGREDQLILLEEERANATIARQICELREQAGLSQRVLARLVGTTASVICRLEDADYEGHSLAMLRRIARALDKRVEIRFISASRGGLGATAVAAVRTRTGTVPKQRTCSQPVPTSRPR
jgi:ribosome-binding protein aMBF1 (putative translation factor)